MPLARYYDDYVDVDVDVPMTSGVFVTATTPGYTELRGRQPCPKFPSPRRRFYDKVFTGPMYSTDNVDDDWMRRQHQRRHNYEIDDDVVVVPSRSRPTRLWSRTNSTVHVPDDFHDVDDDSDYDKTFVTDVDVAKKKLANSTGKSKKTRSWKGLFLGRRVKAKSVYGSDVDVNVFRTPSLSHQNQQHRSQSVTFRDEILRGKKEEKDKKQTTKKLRTESLSSRHRLPSSVAHSSEASTSSSPSADVENAPPHRRHYYDTPPAGDDDDYDVRQLKSRGRTPRRSRFRGFGFGLAAPTAPAFAVGTNPGNFFAYAPIFASRYGHDAFVNSHEWTLSRTISEMRLGVVGTTNSGKTSLVHRYLTGTYTAEENPEGGRFKKEVVIEGQSHLLLIRDEGQAPLDVQFCQWVDAVVFVFSVTSADSFDSIHRFYQDMNKLRNVSDLPLILVGTKENVSEKKARVITEEDGRQLAAHLKRCAYYETSSTYGTNVERVFKEACCKIIQHRLRHSFGIVSARTPTPTQQDKKDYQDSSRYGMSTAVFAAPSGAPVKGGYRVGASSTSMATHGGVVDGPSTTAYQTPHAASRRSTAAVVHHREQQNNSRGAERSMSALLGTPMPFGNDFQRGGFYRGNGALSPSSSQKSVHSISNGMHSRSSAALLLDSDGGGSGGMSYSIDSMASACGVVVPPNVGGGLGGGSNVVSASTSHLPTPSSTPNTQRKNRRISNIFQRPKDHHDEKTKAIEALNLGVGRAIPVKQGLLYKKSTKSALNREWKKKYVCLYSDGRLTYHQNLKDYMDKSAHHKEVFLKLATVKVAGRQRPRNTQRSSAVVTASTSTIGGTGVVAVESTGSGGTPTLQSYESRRSDAGEGTSGGGSDEGAAPKESTTFTPPAMPQTVAGVNPKKKQRGAHRRIGSSGKHTEDEDECFEIVTHSQQRWEFCAASTEERDEWVAAIEEQIEIALTSQTTQPTSRATGNKHQVLALKQLPGNDRCADCGQPNPDWASLNLGTLICIECSGIHRNLGSHVSRVRSLELDDWPLEFLAVMQAIGNEAANRMWEHDVVGAADQRRPTPDSPREAKEAWIRGKYELKRFLPSLHKDDVVDQMLVAAVIARDVATTSLLLARASPDDVNGPVSAKDHRTPLHLACSIGSLEIVQLLIWNNADVRALDEHGRSCLWYAQHNGFADCADVLMTAGLAPDYGFPSTAPNSANTSAVSNFNAHLHQMPEGMIMGSMSSRDRSANYSLVSADDSATTAVRGRVGTAPAPPPHMKRPGHQYQQQTTSSTSTTSNGTAFEMLPASII